MSLKRLNPSRHSEGAFETIIENYLLENGYHHLIPPYDVENAIFPNEVIAFIQATQPKEWAKLLEHYGDNITKKVLGDLIQWMNIHGTLSTLRHGFKCHGRLLRVAFFKAAHNLNLELETQYRDNRLGIIRQLHYSSRDKQKSLDMVIALNGIPLITIELKNPLTHQTVKHAIEQYEQDRDPRERIFEFTKRTLIHFAVDTDEVWMTTRLAGNATHFLPFNRGNNGGAGNPIIVDNYSTAYLWEEVLQRDSFLDLFGSFLHLQTEDKQDEAGRKYKVETLVFPRYHQLEAVRALIFAARQEGTGHNYLIEHSAGSGKSNTIAWLAHRLSSLHNNQDERIFDSVVVITDRRVLDRQLQDTIFQFEHKDGVVKKIDEDSLQLAKALESAVPIIITTLQKFPFVSRQLLKMAEDQRKQSKSVLPTRKFAVIVDEAHSSQSGESATELKGVLGGEKMLEEAQERAREEGKEDLEDLFREMAKRSRQDNLSFFAFTATPKHKTLAIFGRNSEPFHRYTMRQAIEEGFIMDVLRHYTTYKTYYKLVKSCEDDPNVERKQAARDLSRFMRLHPYNIAQKTEIMVEHFYTMTQHKIGGKAKAMVVTGSRLEAIRYKQAFDDYIKRKGYPIKTLVAFSGTVQDPEIQEITYTELEMNGFKERELPEKFASSEYQVLLVAEKYQTGFDQPLLHTLYVDKRLSGIQAVQTLSRLNRIHPHKEDTFVLDFVNEREEIRESFKQYYEGSQMGDEADPAQLYQLKAELDKSGIYLQSELEQFCLIYFAPKRKQNIKDHTLMNASLKPAAERFKELQENSPEDAETWRSKLLSFRNLYAFLSQIIPYQDSDLEQLYVFIRHLSAILPRRASVQYDFDNEVSLAYYRLQKISEGSIDLNNGDARRLDGPTEVGTGESHEEKVALSQVVQIINERFGTEFTEADQLFFDQLIEEAVQSEELKQSARANPEDKFGLLFKRLLQDFFIERIDQNEAIFARYMNDENFQATVSQLLGKEVYERLNTDDLS